MELFFIAYRYPHRCPWQLIHNIFQGFPMHRIISSAIVLTSCLCAATASAQVVQKKAASGAAKAESVIDQGLQSQGLKNAGLYGELGLSLLDYRISGTGISGKPVALRAVVGYDYLPYLAAEAMLGFGLSGFNATGVYGSAYRVSTGTLFGAYVKPRLVLGEGTEVFARLGIASTGTSVGGYAGTDSGAGLSYGVGLKMQTPWRSFGHRPISVSGDYMSYYSGSGVKFSGFTIGAGMSF